VESKIIGYRGIANKNRIIISGHAFVKHKVKDTLPHHGRRRNLKQTIRRFRARPLKWTTIEVRVNGDIKKVRTNNRGYFTCEVQHKIEQPGWYPYELYWKRNQKNSKMSITCLMSTKQVLYQTLTIRYLFLIVQG
jgi:hypothetical protein